MIAERRQGGPSIANALFSSFFLSLPPTLSIFPSSVPTCTLTCLYCNAMPRSARRLVPHKETSNKCAPLTRLAELAVGLPVRWQKRLHGSSYKDDPDVLRVMLWHTWATKRVEYFHTVTCKTLSVKRRSEHRTGLEKWLVEKHDTLKTARSSGRLLPVDVAEQVVRQDQARIHGHVVLSCLLSQMQIDIDAVLEHLNVFILCNLYSTPCTKLTRTSASIAC